MNVLEHLREWSASSDEWEEYCDTYPKVSDAPTAEGRAAAGRRVADLLESFADRMERSRLVRASASVFTPDGLRAKALEYRAGRDPHANDDE